MRNVSDKICRESQNTHFILIDFPENLAVYEIMWESIIEPYRLQITIWLMRAACWIIKATDTQSEYVLIIV
jgi:adenylate kinase family enzyme